MKILIIGSGGREHAIGQKIWCDSQKNNTSVSLYFTPGNAGTSQIGENIDIADDNIEKLCSWALQNSINLVIVGPELPLSLGIVDKMRNVGVSVFGPDKLAAQLESSKSFSKSFMKKYDIPTADYRVFEDSEDAICYLTNASYPLVVKADGLASGKGVFICQDSNEAISIANDILCDKLFGDQGSSIIVEEFLEGEEVSLLCFTDSKTILPMQSAKDYKRAFDNDKGPNTGGMGSISPSPNLANASANIDKIANKTLFGIQQEKFDYRGVIYIGLMLTKSGPKVLEYNVRFGDPETEALLPRLENNLVDVINAVEKNNLSSIDLKWSDKKAVCVMLASNGYPGEYKTGERIILPEISDDISVFHCGTAEQDGKFYSNGGRVLAITALGENMQHAKNTCYDFVNKIDFPNSFYRKDIGD